MTPNQRAAFILSVLGFLPAVCTGPVAYHSPQHYAIGTAFAVGILAFGWLICVFRE